MRTWKFCSLVLMVACKGNVGVIDVGDSDADTDPDFTAYDNATLRVVSPKSGDFLALEEAHAFEATLTGADALPLDFTDVTWESSADSAWAPVGLSFSDDTLNVGRHDITAEASLPNGDRLAYSVGGVLIQSWYAGTYTGLFSSNTTYDTYVIACSGAATLVVEATGKKATGSADCLISFNGFDLPAAYNFDLDNDDGELTGVANADIGGFWEVPFDATGRLDRVAGTMTIAFSGAVFDTLTIDATVDTERVSLDAGL